MAVAAEGALVAGVAERLSGRGTAQGLGAAWTGRGVDGAGCGAVAVAMAEDSTSAGPGGGACSLFRRTAGKLSVDVGAPPHRVEFSG
jgi:hypothetical protein